MATPPAVDGRSGGGGGGNEGGVPSPGRSTGSAAAAAAAARAGARSDAPLSPPPPPPTSPTASKKRPSSTAAGATNPAGVASAGAVAAAVGSGRRRRRVRPPPPLPPPTPSRSIHALLRDRQRRGPVRFVSREGAGVWSPDPLHRAFGGSAATLRRLELSGLLRGHAGCVNTVSVTPDGRYLITGSDDMKLMIWDCESHARKSSFFSGHRNNVFQARVLPYTDNEKIVTCAADGQVRLAYLSRASSKLLGRHRGRAHRLAIEPGSPHRFMTCGEDGVVLSFDLRTASAQAGSTGAGGVPLLRRPGSRGISGMALNPADPNYLFVCGDSPFLDCYDARKVDFPAARFCPRSLRGSRGAHITGVAVNWCGSEVVATYNPSGEIYRFDVKKNAVENTSASFASSSSSSSSCSDDEYSWRRRGHRSVRQRRMERAAATGNGSGNGSGVDGVAPASGSCTLPTESATASTFRSSGSDSGGAPRCWPIREGGNGGAGSGGADERNEDGAAEDEEEEEEEDDEEDGEEGKGDAGGAEDSSYAARFVGHRNVRTVKQVNFYGPRSEFVVSGSDCGHIFFWDKTSAKLEMLLWGDRVGAVNCLEPHPFLPMLATSGLSHSAKVWRPSSMEAVDALVGKKGKPAAEIIRANTNPARIERDATGQITQEMFLRIMGLTDPDNTSDGGERAAEEGTGAGGAGRGGNEAAAAAARLSRRAAFLAVLHRATRPETSSSDDDDNDDEDGEEEGEEEEEEEEEEDDDEDEEGDSESSSGDAGGGEGGGEGERASSNDGGGGGGGGDDDDDSEDDAASGGEEVGRQEDEQEGIGGGR